jgi:hypothetical protein
VPSHSRAFAAVLALTASAAHGAPVVRDGGASSSAMQSQFPPPPRANSGGCLMGLPRTSSGKPSHEMNGSSHRYGAPRWYRASRRSTLLRLVIPAALGITIAGFAIGAGVAYFSDGGSAAHSPATPRPPSHAALPATHHAPAAESHGGQSGPAAPSATARAAPTPATYAEGHRLNDEGYALIRRADYAAAIAPLREAVGDLAGAGPEDPYEAYANYNLGYALLRTGRCAEALAPLEAANALETSPAVDRALREARGCAPAGS